MWTNPIETLLAFLGEPTPDLWLRRAEAVTAGAMKVAQAKSASGPEGVAERVMASLHGSPLPASAPGKVAVCSGVDVNDCPLTIIADQRSGFAWSAFAVIDDRRETIVADEETHKRRWAAWLYWGNLLQFLDGGSGDSGQLAITGLDGFDPSLLAAAGGGGFLTALSLLPLGEDLRDDIEPVRPAPEPPAVPVELPAVQTETVMSRRWEEILDLLDPDEPGLAQLAQALASLGVGAPGEVGFELGEQAWQAEVAWPSAKVAIVLAGNDDEARKRDEAYAEAGWDVRDVQGWTPEELAALIGGTK
jgi:hypothetical protein